MLMEEEHKKGYRKKRPDKIRGHNNYSITSY